MCLFKRQIVDPIEKLYGKLVSIRNLWETRATLPAIHQQNVAFYKLAALRDAYQKATAIVVVRVGDLIEQPNNEPTPIRPAALACAALLGHAIH